MSEADARTRTGDPFITSEVLYQLSYVGRSPYCSGTAAKREAPERASLMLWTGIGQVSSGGLGVSIGETTPHSQERGEDQVASNQHSCENE